MKKIFLLIIIALLSYSSSFAIGSFKVVIKKPGAAIDVQVRIVDYTPTGPTTKFTGATVSLTPNASGIIVASVPMTDGIVVPENILATDINAYYIVEVWTGSPLALTSQQRLDEMIFEQAQTGLTDNEGNLTLEPGKELIFPEPSGSGTNFTSFKSPALAADVEYTLPDNDGNPNQYLKTDGSGIMSWDTPPTSPTGAAGGSLAGTYPNPTIAAGAISNNELAANAVTTGKIADGTIVNADVDAAAAIAYSKLNLATSIGTGDLAGGAVTTAKIANGTVRGQVLTYDGSSVAWSGNGSLPVSTSNISYGNLTNRYQNLALNGRIIRLHSAGGAITNETLGNAANDTGTNIVTVYNNCGHNVTLTDAGSYVLANGKVKTFYKINSTWVYED
ncbi:MAG: hypothetical protein WC121_04350 [Candidatus Kapaibacterium sp.]